MGPWLQPRCRTYGPSTACCRPGSSDGQPMAKKKKSADRTVKPELESIRGKIDAVDRELHELINRRAELARAVGVSKHASGHLVDFYRPEREAEVLRMALARNDKGPLRDEEVLRLFREIMSACLAQEKPLKVAYLGPEGTYAQSAVLKHFGHSVRALALTSIDEVFQEVQAGNADFGVVPVENSTEGTVNNTLDRFLSTSLNICGEVELRVQHSLMARDKDMRSVKRVCAHPQALGQCRGWLDEHLSGVERKGHGGDRRRRRRRDLWPGNPGAGHRGPGRQHHAVSCAWPQDTAAQ